MEPAPMRVLAPALRHFVQTFLKTQALTREPRLSPEVPFLHFLAL